MFSADLLLFLKCQKLSKFGSSGVFIDSSICFLVSLRSFSKIIVANKMTKMLFLLITNLLKSLIFLLTASTNNVISLYNSQFAFDDAFQKIKI